MFSGRNVVRCCVLSAATGFAMACASPHDPGAPMKAVAGQGCKSLVMEECCNREFSDALCADGIDNDGNGKTDCDDGYCRVSLFITVCGYEYTDVLCADGKDNDGNKQIDCADPHCAKTKPCLPKGTGPGPEDTLAACSDHADNDGNGFADCTDYGCSKSKDQAVLEYCVSIGENTLAKCSDGIDQDGNGYTDCADLICEKAEDAGTVAYCASMAEATYERCADGIDNNKNGFADCADFSCSHSAEPWPGHDGNTVTDYCATILETSFAKCTDHIDNDGNGYADCQDYACFGAKDAAVAQACQESLPDDAVGADAKCSDGKDNDKDGYTDCDDWDCSWNPQVTTCAGQSKVCGPATKTPGVSASITQACDAACATMAKCPDPSGDQSKEKCLSECLELGDDFGAKCEATLLSLIACIQAQDDCKSEVGPRKCPAATLAFRICSGCIVTAGDSTCERCRKQSCCAEYQAGLGHSDALACNVCLIECKGDSNCKSGCLAGKCAGLKAVSDIADKCMTAHCDSACSSAP